MKNLIKLSCLMVFLALAACTSPKRGEIAFAPVKPTELMKRYKYDDAIYQSGSAWLLHEDIRARAVGDMLTVTLQEKMDAELTASTGSSKSSNSSITSPTIFGRTPSSRGKDVFDNSLVSDHSFDGSGESSQSNSLTGSVTVMVVDVLANGNLVVQGEKWININQGEEFIRLRGIIRPDDIGPDNTISSTRIANADIQYGGDSFLAGSNEPGWLTKFFQSKWMPF